MRSSTGRGYFPSSASNRNLTNFFESQKHQNSLVLPIYKSFEGKNIALLRYLSYGVIALGITVITVTIVFLPFLFASLDMMKENVRSNEDIFKAKSNTLWSQMQSLKRNIYRRSIASDPDSLRILELLPKGFIPFPFQKFRLNTSPPSINPHNFKEILTKEITKLFEEILMSSSNNNENNSTKKFNDPSSSLSIKGPKGSTIISSVDGEDEEYEMTIKALLESIKGNETMMEKLSEMEIVERMKNAFKLAEQEQIEREGENSENTVPENESYENNYGNTVSNPKFLMTTNNSLERSTTTKSSFPDSYENSNMEQQSPSNAVTVNHQTHSSTILPKNYNNINEGMIYDSSLITNLQNSTAESITEPLETSETSYQETDFPHETSTTYPVNPQTTYTPNSVAVNPSTNPYKNTVIEENRSDLFNLHKNIIFIETLEDEQKCTGDPGEPGNDGFDGVDGISGLDGLPGDDGEKATFWDICNC